MTMTQRSTVVGVFQEREQARAAIESLKDAGFSPDTISILSPDKQTTQDMAEETGTHAGSGAATGAVTGGILGGVGGWLVGVGALAIPGVGPFIAAGAFATALGGAAIGAGVGAVAGALVGMGLPKEEAEYYEGEVKSGRTLVTVRADGRYDEAQRLLRQGGAYDIESRDAAGDSAASANRISTASVAPSRSTTAGEQRVELRQEELHARTQPVQTGEVVVGKRVVSEERTVEVPVTREEVVVERHAVDRRPTHDTIDDRGETIEVPVTEERVSVQKQPMVYEEVEVGKRSVQETQQVSGTVRREELRVDDQGNVLQNAGVSARSSSGWSSAMPSYRTRWQQQYGSQGGRWEDVEPAYEYGYGLREQPQYRGRSWSEIEPDVQRDWTRSHPNTPWDRARQSIRDTWDAATDR